MSGVHQTCCVVCRGEVEAPDYVGVLGCKCGAVRWRRLDADHIEFGWVQLSPIPFPFYRCANWHPEQTDGRGHVATMEGWW